MDTVERRLGRISDVVENPRTEATSAMKATMRMLAL